MADRSCAATRNVYYNFTKDSPSKVVRALTPQLLELSPAGRGSMANSNVRLVAMILEGNRSVP